MKILIDITMRRYANVARNRGYYLTGDSPRIFFCISCTNEIRNSTFHGGVRITLGSPPFALKGIALLSPLPPRARARARWNPKQEGRTCRFSFKFVNTEITIEYAKQHQRPPRNSCVSGYTTLCKARKNQRDYYMGAKNARSYSALQFSEQPRGMKYSIIRRYCKLDPLFQRCSRST